MLSNINESLKLSSFVCQTCSLNFITLNTKLKRNHSTNLYDKPIWVFVKNHWWDLKLIKIKIHLKLGYPNIKYFKSKRRKNCHYDSQTYREFLLEVSLDTSFNTKSEKVLHCLMDTPDHGTAKNVSHKHYI